jgi:hypothetical protein
MMNAEAIDHYGTLKFIFSGTESQRDIATTCREDSTSRLPPVVAEPPRLSNE